MPHYLVANYLSDDVDSYTVTEAMVEEIHALNRELIAAGARKFACRISPAANVERRSVRKLNKIRYKEICHEKNHRT